MNVFNRCCLVQLEKINRLLKETDMFLSKRVSKIYLKVAIEGK